MATPTVGTIPALPQYGTGGLALASTVAIEIVDTAVATAAASYRMSQIDFVGKAPGVMLPANPVANDVIAFLQVSSNLPFVTTIGNLAIPSGNLPTGGATGTLLNKVSGTNFSAQWSGISSFLTASTSITLTGSTTVAVSVSTGGISSSQIANNAVGNAQLRQGSPVSVIGVAGAATANVADIIAAGGTMVLLSNINGTGISFGRLTTTYMPIQFQLGNTTTNGVMVSNGSTSPLTATNFGTTGMFLMGNGSLAAPSFNLVNLGNSTSVTGTTAIARGGTGTGVLTPFGVMLGGTTIVSVVPATTAGLFLQAQNATTAPAFALVNLAAATNVTGVTGFANGGTGTTTLATPFGVVVGGTTTLSVTAAGATGTLLAGNTATSAPSFISISAALNTVNSTQGSILYRDSAAWLALAGGTAGFVLQTQGTTANPQWVGGNGVLLNTIAANQLGSAVDTTSFTARYSRFRIAFENICPVSTALVTTSLNMQVATSGVNWIAAGYISNVETFVNATAAFASSTTVILLSGNVATTTVGTSTLYGTNGFIEINNPANAVFRKSISGELAYMATGAAGTATNAVALPYAIWDGASTAITGINIAFQTGNIATGTIRIYGIS